MSGISTAGQLEFTLCLQPSMLLQLLLCVVLQGSRRLLHVSMAAEDS